MNQSSLVSDPTSDCTISGTNRTVQLTWGAATDTNLNGYRLYRSVDSGPFVAVSTIGIGVQEATNVHKKNLGSVRFIVRAYDKAGNESVDTNTRSFSKNSCA
jgi:hypothetical protein